MNMAPETADKTRAAGRATKPWPMITLGFLALLIYGQAIGFGHLGIWDDRLYLFGRPEVSNWWAAGWYDRLMTPKLGYPVPVPTALLAMANEVGGASAPAIAHAINLAFHLGNVVLVYLLARRWFDHRGVAWASAAVWAAHPLLAESVVWITSIKTVGFAFFSLLTLYAWERILSRGSAAWRALVAAAFLAALGCRPDAVVLPAVLGAYTLFRARDQLRERRVWAPIAAGAVLSAVYLAAFVHFYQAHLAKVSGSAGFGGDYLRQAQAIFSNLTRQLEKIVWVQELHPAYVLHPDSAWRLWVGVGLLALLAAAAVWSWKHCRIAWWGLALFGLFFLPVSELQYVPRYAADAYMYLPLLGLIIAIAGVVDQKVDWSERNRRIARLAATAVVVVTSLLSFLHAQRWRSVEALWRPVLEEKPYIANTYYVLSRYYLRHDNLEGAREIFERGMPIMSERGTLPAAAASVFERTGSPDLAVEALVEILSDDRPDEKGAAGYLVQLLYRYRVDIAHDENARRATLRASRRVLQSGKLDANPQALRTLATYFDEQGHSATANLYRERLAAVSRAQ